MIEFFNHIKLHSKGSDIVLLAMVVTCVLALTIALGCSKTSEDSGNVQSDPVTKDAPSQASSRVLLTESTPPCNRENASNTVCRPRDVSIIGLLSPQIEGSSYEYETPDTEELLEKGMHAAGASPTHIALRGAARSGTVRCAWHNVVRTAEQREQAVRYWLGMDSDEPLPSPSKLETVFNSYIEQMVPQIREEMRANFNLLAHGGVSTDALMLACYVDFDAYEYMLGKGPSIVTVAYCRMATTTSYDLYGRSHAVGRYGSAKLMTQTEFASANAGTVSSMESRVRKAVEGRESVVFLAPMGAHNTIAIEVWQAVAQWDLQSSGGTVNAVRYGTDEPDPEHSQTLSSLKSRVQSAAASDDFAGRRIANVVGLTEYYRGIGAYGNIGPFETDQGGPRSASEHLFTPSQPPPIPGRGDLVTRGDDGDDLEVKQSPIPITGEEVLSPTATSTPTLTPTAAATHTPTSTRHPRRRRLPLRHTRRPRRPHQLLPPQLRLQPRIPRRQPQHPHRRRLPPLHIQRHRRLHRLLLQLRRRHRILQTRQHRRQQPRRRTHPLRLRLLRRNLQRLPRPLQPRRTRQSQQPRRRWNRQTRLFPPRHPCPNRRAPYRSHLRSPRTSRLKPRDRSKSPCRGTRLPTTPPSPDTGSSGGS